MDPTRSTGGVGRAPDDARLAVTARAPKAKPDPLPMRLAIGMTGLAAMSAMATAILAPAAPATAGTTTAAATGADDPLAPASVPVRHVTRYVQLQPGQTAPPAASVRVQPTPKPKVVVVQTRQSGKP